MRKLNQMTDEELALAYVEGDNKAFDLLLSRCEVKLFSYILFVVHDEELANDIFQETFVKAIVKLQDGQYSPNGKFVSWLMRIAHNVIVDGYRDAKNLLTELEKWNPDVRQSIWGAMENIKTEYLPKKTDRRFTKHIEE